MVQIRMQLRGCFRVLNLYDVSESIELTQLRALLGTSGGGAGPSFSRRTPEYVRFELPPVVEPAEDFSPCAGVNAKSQLKYYAFVVVVVQIIVPFEGDWSSLLEQGSGWMDSPEIEPRVRELIRRRLDRLPAPMIRPTQDWLQENYRVVEIYDALDGAGKRLTSEELVDRYGGEIAQTVRGESLALSSKARDETLQESVSYYPSDLVVVGAHSAVVYDRAEDAIAASQVLEYAKVQLLEFRYYDRFMTRVLADFYTALDAKKNVLLARWSVPREARRFNTIRLDVMELTERVDNAIKFVSEIYYARIYRLAAGRIGVPDYRKLVEEKLNTVGELYSFMVDQFNETRSFALEVFVTILTIIDVIFLFRGK